MKGVSEAVMTDSLKKLGLAAGLSENDLHSAANMFRRKHGEAWEPKFRAMLEHRAILEREHRAMMEAAAAGDLPKERHHRAKYEAEANKEVR